MVDLYPLLVASCHCDWLAVALADLDKIPQPKRGPRRDNVVIAKTYFNLIATELLLNQRRTDQVKLNLYHIRKFLIKRKLGKFSLSGKTVYWLDWFEQQPSSLYEVVEKGSNMREENTQVKLHWDFLTDLELEHVPAEAIREHYEQDQPDMTETAVDTKSLQLYIDRTRQAVNTKQRWSKRQQKMVYAYPDWIETAKSNLTSAVQIQRLVENGKLKQPFKVSPFGRVYYGGVNLQSCSRQVRHAALGPCYSIDFSVCSAAWKLYTAEQIVAATMPDKELRAPKTQLLIRYKTDFRRDLARLIGDKHIQGAKRILTAVGFGATLNKQGWPQDNGQAGVPAIKQGLLPEQVEALEHAQWFKDFMLEQEQLTKIICDYHLKYPVPDCVRDGAGRIQRNKVMAWLYQQQEQEYLGQIAEYIQQRYGNDTILLAVHDCLYLRVKPDIAEINGLLLGLNPYLMAELTEHHGHYESKEEKQDKEYQWFKQEITWLLNKNTELSKLEADRIMMKYPHYTEQIFAETE